MAFYGGDSLAVFFDQEELCPFIGPLVGLVQGQHELSVEGTHQHAVATVGGEEGVRKVFPGTLNCSAARTRDAQCVDICSERRP